MLPRFVSYGVRQFRMGAHHALSPVAASFTVAVSMPKTTRIWWVGWLLICSNLWLGTGYAAFGRVIEGMDVVRSILGQPRSEDGQGVMKGQMIANPVKILTLRRTE
jgi:cyclophilin family peptidyl-prolyl cis-trans isomerase